MTDRYIAFLRGMNVGSHRVSMEQLRHLFTETGLTHVRSYINSGNLFFDTEEKHRPALAERIERHLYGALGYEVPIFLRTVVELQGILAQNPFKEIKQTEEQRFCVLFTADPLNEKLALPVHSSKKDMDLIAVNKYEAFVIWHIINGRPPAGTFPADILPVRNTSRFFHTLEKILRAAQE
jgi:uncharacterized protein (DUF1697 family)